MACASAVAAEPALRFVAVVLPAGSKSKAFRLASESIKAGLSAAARVHGSNNTYPLRVFDVGEGEQESLDAFIEAQSQGAVAVVGPLTRSAVNYLADSATLSIPVLALNNFDEGTLRRHNLYSFGLSIEAEVQQLVRLMRSQQIVAPAVVKAEGPLSQRMQLAFVDAWHSETGREPVVINVHDARQQAAELKSALRDIDAVFFAADGRRASLIRPYLPADCLLYATSQIVSGRSVPFDLNGVRYLEMPWLINPDAPEYAAYARKRAPTSDEERLFAVGVDAWWLAQLLARAEAFEAVDGVSGMLRPGEDGVISRELSVVVASRPAQLPPEPLEASMPAEAAP